MARHKRGWWTRFRTSVVASVTALTVGVVGIVAVPALAADEELSAYLDVEKSYGTGSGIVDDAEPGAVVPSVTPGVPFSYTINVGCSVIDAFGCYDAIVTDELPEPLVLSGTSPVAAGGGTVTLAPDRRSFTVEYQTPIPESDGRVGLSDGTARTITVTVVVPEDASADLNGTLDNTAFFAAANAATVSDSAPVELVVPDRIEVAVAKDASPATVAALAGRQVTYTITAANTSNRSVDELVVTDPSDGTDPFENLELTGISGLVAPAGATSVRVDTRTGAGTWAQGTPTTLAGLDPATLLDGVDLPAVTGIRLTFVGADGAALPPASLEEGAGTVTLTTRVRAGLSLPEGLTTVTNTASAAVRVGGGDPVTATEPAEVTLRNVAPQVVVTKQFDATSPGDPHLLAVGSGAVVSLVATNTGKPVVRLTVTEPSVGGFSDQGLGFEGFVPAADDGLEWPDGASSATVVYRLVGGETSEQRTTAKHTLPAAPDPSLVDGFTVTFEGDIDSTEAASLPFRVTALPLDFTPGTDPGNLEATNEVAAEVESADGASAADDASAPLEVRPLRVLSDLEKTIGRAESWAVPGVRIPVSFAAGVSEDSTTGSELVEVTDGPGEFWDVMDLAGFVNVPVPPGTALTIHYFDGATWLPVPGAVAVTQSPFSHTPESDVLDAAQGVRFTFTPTTPGTLLDPGFVVAPSFVGAVRSTSRATEASIDGLALEGGADGLEVTNTAAVRVRNGDSAVPVPEHGTVDEAETALLSLSCETCAPDLVEKTWFDSENLLSMSDATTTARIGWTTGGLPFDTVVVSDPAVTPADAAAVPAVASTAYDAFDLVRVRPITPASDPAIAGDRVTKVELATADGWVDVTAQACATGEACTGTFPGLVLTAEQQAVTVGVRLTFTSTAQGGVVTEGDGLRPLDLELRLRRTLRSNPTMPVVGNQLGLVYNVPATGDTPANAGLVRNTAAVTGRIGEQTTTSTADADANIVESDINIALTKTIDDDPASNAGVADQANVGLPPTGVAADAFPTVDVRLLTTNSSSGGARSLVLADPVPGTPLADSMYEHFDLVGIRAVGTPATRPGSELDSSIALTRADEPDEPEVLSVEDALALDASALADVVGFTLVHEGDLSPGSSTAQEMAVLTFRLRATTRSTGDPVAVDAAGTLVDNVAVVALSRLAPGTDPADLFPGLTTAQERLLEQEDQADDDVLVVRPTYGVTLEKEIADTVAPDPSTSGARDHVRAEGSTAPVTVTLQARPTGTAQTRVLTVTDASPTFFNTFTFQGFRSVTLPDSVGELRVSVLTTSGSTPVNLATGGGSVGYTCAGSAVLDDCWVAGAWQTRSGSSVTPVLPGGVAAADVVAVRYELRADATGSAWQRPSRPRVTVAFDAVRRTHLRSDATTPVPSTLPEIGTPAPGETALGRTTNDAEVRAVGAWPTSGGQEWTAEDDATDSTLLRHLRTQLRVTKAPGTGTAAALAQDPAARIPYVLTITNPGERGILEPTILDQVATDGGGSLLVEPDLFDPTTGVETPVYSFTYDGAPAAGFAAALDETSGLLTVTVPAGFVLAPGKSLVVTAGLDFRTGLAAGTPVSNTVTVTADRPLDLCEFTTNHGPLEDDTSRGTTCAATTLVAPDASAPLRVTKSVKGVDAGVPGATAGDANVDDLGVKAVGSGASALAEACAAPNEPATSATHYVHPCLPITRAGGVEEWKAAFVNNGNVPADRIVAIDVLPRPDDRGVIVNAARGSQFRTRIAGGGDFAVVAPLGSTGATATWEVFYTTAWPLETWCNRNDLTATVNGTEDSCSSTRWLPAASASAADLADATAVKLVVDYPEGGLAPGAGLTFSFRTRTPAFAPTATASEPVAYNSIAFTSRGITEAGPVVTRPLEPRKVGVTMATGLLDLAKTVRTPSPWRATTQMPSTYPFQLACTSAGEDVVLAGSAGSAVDGTFTVPVPSDGTVLTVGGANLNLPLFADCSVTEPELVGSTATFTPSADGGVTASDVRAVRSLGGRADVHHPWTTTDAVGTFAVTNAYANAGFTVRKTVDDGGALDHNNTAIERAGWTYPFTASCLFLGTEVLGAAERSFTLTAGAERQFTGIPVGSVCTVTETDARGAQQVAVSIAGESAPGAALEQAQRRAIFTVAGPGDDAGAGSAAATTVTVANTFTTGSVVISKTFEGEGLAAWSGDTIQLRLVCTITQPSGLPTPRTVFDRTWTYTKPAGGWEPFSQSVGNLPTSAVCLLTEPQRAGASTVAFSPASSPQTSPTSGRVVVGRGTAVTVDATNTFTVGAVRVSKALSGPALATGVPLTMRYTVELRCTRTAGLPAVPVEAKVITGASSATWTNLPTGASCVAVETLAERNDPVSGWVALSTDEYTPSNPAPVTVGGAGTTLDTTITNTFPSTELRVAKAVTGDASSWAPATFAAAVTCTWHGAPVALGSVTLPRDGSPVTVTNVPVGSMCSVAETGAHGATSVAVSPSGPFGISADAASPTTFTVTNTYDASAFEVSKTVVTAAPDASGVEVGVERSYTFDLSCTLAGTTRTGTVTLAHGQSATITELPVGSGNRLPAGASCSVTELAPGDASTASVTLTPSVGTITGRTATFTLPAGGTAVAPAVAVAYTNTYPVGSVEVTKTVTGNGTAWATRPFTVAMVCSAPVGVDGDSLVVFDGTHTFTRDTAWDEQTWTVDGLLAGASCVVTETATGGATTVVSSGAVTVTDGGTAEVTVTNTFTLGDVEVTKALLGSPADLVAARNGRYTVELVCTREIDGATVPVSVPGGATRTIDFGTSRTVRYEGLPTGAACALTETGSTPPAQATTYAVDGGTATSTSASFTVGSVSDVEVVVTNSFGTTQLAISKSIVTDGVDARYVPDNFEVTLTCDWYGDDVSPSAPVTVAGGSSTFVTGLPVGTTCSVEETGEHGATSVTYAVTQPGDTTPTVITPDDQLAVDVSGGTTFTVTNSYALSAGFDLTKTTATDAVDASGAAVAVGRDFTFDLACRFLGAAVEEVPDEVTVAAGDTVSVAGMPVGSECDVTEQPTGDASTATIDVTGGSGVSSDDAARTATFTVGAGTTPSVAVAYENTYPVGEITVTKALDGSGAALWAQGPFDVDLRCVLPGAGVGGGDLDVWEDTLTFERSGAAWQPAELTRTVEGLPVGAVCALVETARGGANAVAFTAPEGSVTVDDADADPVTVASARVTVPGAAGTPVEVTVTNTFTLGALEVTKVLDGPTAPALDPALDGTYEVTAVCTRPVDGIQVPIAVPGGATRTFTGTGATRTVTFEDLPTGATCEITETTSTPTPQAVSYTVDGATGTTPPTLTILEGTATAGVTVTNTFLDGTVVARKLVVGDGASHAPADFAATVTCTWEGATVPLPDGGRVTLPGDGTVVPVGDAPEGAVCSIVEDTTGAGQTAVEVSDPVTLVAGETATLTVTNTYELTGLTVTKQVVGALGTDGSPVTYTAELAFEVSCLFRGTEVVAPADRAFTLRQGGTRTLVGIPVGAECVVTETDAAGATATTTTLVSDGEAATPAPGTTATLTLLRGTEHEVVVTNTMPTGTVAVTKVLDGAGATRWGTGEFEMHLVCVADDVEGGTVHDALHVLTAEAPTLTVADLPVGATCSVVETRTGGAHASTVTVGSDVVTDAADATAVPATFTVTNTFDVAALEVVKEIVGDAAAGVDDATQFVVSLVCTRPVDGEDVTIEVPGGALRTLSRDAGLVVRYENLPATADCVLTEVGTGQADGTEIVVPGGDDELVVAGTSADVALAGADVTVRVANRFDEVPPPGGDDGSGGGGGLAVTGTQVALMTVVAMLLLALGGALVVVRRRRV